MIQFVTQSKLGRSMLHKAMKWLVQKVMIIFVYTFMVNMNIIKFNLLNKVNVRTIAR